MSLTWFALRSLLANHTFPSSVNTAGRRGVFLVCLTCIYVFHPLLLCAYGSRNKRLLVVALWLVRPVKQFQVSPNPVVNHVIVHQNYIKLLFGVVYLVCYPILRYTHLIAGQLASSRPCVSPPRPHVSPSFSQGICDKDHTLQQTIAGPEQFAMKKDPFCSMIYLFP